MTDLDELECLLASGLDLPTALAALPVEAAEPMKGSRWAWDAGLLIGVTLAVLAMILGLI